MYNADYLGIFLIFNVRLNIKGLKFHDSHRPNRQPGTKRQALYNFIPVI